LHPLSRNPRKEISTSRKIYFYDNGIRNAIIKNFNPISQRNDIGPLWENFFVSERLKYIAYQKLPIQQWFWRSKSKAEIDMIEEQSKRYEAYELKWNEKQNARFSSTFTEFYHPVATHVIHKSNFWHYLSS
jgi:predicted AAA+ superfamily ATPase